MVAPLWARAGSPDGHPRGLTADVADAGPAACWLNDLEPVFADRFPFEPARYETVPDELPGLWPSEPDEPGELMVPAI